MLLNTAQATTSDAAGNVASWHTGDTGDTGDVGDGRAAELAKLLTGTGLQMHGCNLVSTIGVFWISDGFPTTENEQGAHALWVHGLVCMVHS